MEGYNTETFSHIRQQRPVNKVKSKQTTVQQGAKYQPTVQRGANRTVQQRPVNQVKSKQTTVPQRDNSQKRLNVQARTKYPPIVQKGSPTVQQSVPNNTMNKNLQKLEEFDVVQNIMKDATPQEPVQASSGGGSFILNIVWACLIVLLAVVCVIGYYIWYFLTHPMDDLKGIFHL